MLNNGSTIGKAIRAGAKTVLVRPAIDDLVPGHPDQRLYATTATGQLTVAALKEFRDDTDRYLTDYNRIITEKAKICTFLKNSFSEESTMLLRYYDAADKAKDAYDLYSLAKTIHTLQIPHLYSGQLRWIFYQIQAQGGTIDL